MTAAEVIACCRELATCSEEPDAITRTFLCPPMREVHARLTRLMEAAGMEVHVDAAGNLRAVYGGAQPDAPRLLIGSHLDTVRDAGPFDGVLGVVVGVALVTRLQHRRLPLSIEVVGFSEEEGVRFGVPFIGSRALAGTIDEALLARIDVNGTTIRDAIAGYGLDVSALAAAKAPADLAGYLEFHIEQGPVLDADERPLGVVTAIVGQTRATVSFAGVANHAGTTPMDLRRDALAAAAEWVVAVEREAHAVAGLVATVGRIEVRPGATNVIPGSCAASLDIRHADDLQRVRSVEQLVARAHEIGERRGIGVNVEIRLDQSSVPMDPGMIARLERAVTHAGYPVHTMTSGAGHDAMILASHMPVGMLFVRSPGGISHHPDEAVLEEDVEAAVTAGMAFLNDMAGAQ